MFSLIDEPWIVGIDGQGNRREVGLRQLFSGEVKMNYLQGDSPAQNYAVLRLLFAIFWRAHAPESAVSAGKTFSYSSWFGKTRSRLLKGAGDQAVLDYLEQFSNRFDLFSEEVPFMQVANLHVESGEVKHVTTIVPESQGSYFSMRAGTERDSLSFAEAARWLIYVQAFDYSGIKSGIVGDSRVKGGKGYPIGTGWSGMTGGTVVQGRDLMETLLLNTTVECLVNPADYPVWERQPDGADSRDKVGETAEPCGPADLATWQSRRVRLVADGDRVVAVVLGNGDRIPDAGANVFGDPMTPYRFSANKSKKNHDVYYPRPYDPQRMMWKSLDALVVADGDSGFSGKDKAPKRPRNLDNLASLAGEVDGIPDVLHVELVSVEYGPQASSVAATFSSSVNLPVVMLMQQSEHLRQTVRAVAASTLRSAVILGQFAGHLYEAAGGDYEFQPSVTDRALAELEPEFNVWLSDLATISKAEARRNSDKLVDAQKKWEETVRSFLEEKARVLLRGAGPKALAGRLEISGEGAKPQIVSAATFYQQLQRRLDDELKMTVKKKTKKETQ